MARLIALIYNWWTLFGRLADPDHHREALTTRPLLLHGIARQTRHAGQTRLTITASHGRRHQAVLALRRIAKFFEDLRQTAEQLTAAERWRRILSPDARPVEVEWDPDAAVTPLGHLAFFAEYLKLSGRFDALVADCPLVYSSPNAPAKRDVLGTAVLSILAGHWRSNA